MLTLQCVSPPSCKYWHLVLTVCCMETALTQTSTGARITYTGLGKISIRQSVNRTPRLYFTPSLEGPRLQPCKQNPTVQYYKLSCKPIPYFPGLPSLCSIVPHPRSNTIIHSCANKLVKLFLCLQRFYLHVGQVHQ
ncbi:hypothetical protein ATANTOWER_028872 [Ataeniobius toweri]|uniref:Uncharacterized protein n=1 Tax=Ataeniobius toweri TaxID=208326 RepID=A0ABU7CF78_9TELE|nr:hypothetical protein [Ataeniobius toweri]